MTDAIDLTPEQRKTLNDLLCRFVPGVAVWAYGSRVKWTARPNSDLDLVAFTIPAQRAQVADLKDALAESNLPFLVDLHVWDDVPERFREIIQKEYVVVQDKQQEGKTSMPMEWCNLTLGQATDFLSGGTPSKDVPQYWHGTIPWVSAKDMKCFRIYDTEDHVTEYGVENGTKLVPSDTVLLLARGMTLLNDVPICVVKQPMTFNQDVKALRPKPGIQNKFLPYLLLGNKERLLSLVDLAGHGTGRLNSDELKALDVVLPPEPDQRAIAHILGTLDDKIELNRRMNETLEAMARALFKSWFVDFDPVRAKAEGRDSGLPKHIADLFPDSFEESELGEIPKGWEVASVGDLCHRIAMGPFGSDIKTDNFMEFGVPVVRGLNLTKGFVEEGFVYVSDHKADELRNANAFPGDIVITHRGTLGQVGLIPERSRFPRYVVSQSQMLLSVNRDVVTPRYVFDFLGSAAGQHALLANTSQTGVPAIARPTSSVRAIRLVVPPIQVLRHFDRLVAPIYSQRDGSIEESHTLAALRDTLLPKLISGELQVKDAERFVEIG